MAKTCTEEQRLRLEAEAQVTSQERENEIMDKELHAWRTHQHPEIKALEERNATAEGALRQLKGRIRYVSNVSVLSGWTADDWEKQWAALRQMGEKAVCAALSGEGKVWEQVEKALEAVTEYAKQLEENPTDESAWTDLIGLGSVTAEEVPAALAAMRGE